MRVLITNITLAGRTGTEINVRDVACGLQSRGHTPIVYAPALGEIADELRARTIAVVDDLDVVGEAPHVVHGHHHPETMAACLRFPGVPAIFFSHDATAWHDAAPRFPRIRRYVAVDEANRDRLALTAGIPVDRIRVVQNAVDLGRFAPRPPLPSRPRRALVFSHYAGEHPHDRAVRAACERFALPVDVVGKGVGHVSRAPERLLGDYDLVFAKGRSALEALAVGCAVVLVDFVGSGPMVTFDALEHLRRNNFGRRLLTGPLDADVVAAEIARYDAADAARASAAIRATAGLDAQLDALEAIYRDVIDEQARCGADADADLRTASAYVRAWCPRAEDRRLWDALEQRAEGLARTQAERDEAWRAATRSSRECDRLRAEIVRVEAAHRDAVTTVETAAAERAALVAERNALAAEAQALAAHAAALEVERSALVGELAHVRGSATWRLRDRLLRSRLLVALYRTLRRAPRSSDAADVATDVETDRFRTPLRPNA